LGIRGAHLVHGNLLQADYDLTGDLASAQGLAGLGRMSQYSPFSNNDSVLSQNHQEFVLKDSVIGQAVLKRFKGLQNLMSVATATSDYDFVLVTRDSDLWLHKLDLDSFVGEALQDDPVVYTKACLQWLGGVNDKTFLFSGLASKRILPTLYNDFFNETHHALDNSRNAELYWKQLITRVHSVRSRPQHPSRIPTADALWRLVDGSKQLCVKRKYFCKEFTAENTAPMCPQVHD